MLGFMFAATETTNFASQTLISHLIQSKSSMQKVRDEFVKTVYEPAIKEDPSLASLSKSEILNKTVTLETALDCEFTTMCMMEALRYCPSTYISEWIYPLQDVKLGKYYFKKGDRLAINIEALGHNPAEWQRPMEMIPERFDHSNKLSLTPAGNKRHNCSWVPFHGGNRVCFGKTLAETNMKIFTLYLSQKFNFEFEDKRYDTEIPLA